MGAPGLGPSERSADATWSHGRLTTACREMPQNDLRLHAAAGLARASAQDVCAAPETDRNPVARSSPGRAHWGMAAHLQIPKKTFRCHRALRLWRTQPVGRGETGYPGGLRMNEIPLTNLRSRSSQ
jgi:hypothetical protein